MKSARGTILILTAGVFWGLMSLFVRTLTAWGFTSVQIVFMRVMLAGLVFAGIMAVRDRKGFRIAPRDIPLFLGLGLCSVLMFTVCYFTAIQMMSASNAAILLYTSPIWVMLMSLVVFHERITGRKVTALVLAFGGCVLIAGIGGTLTPIGLVIGLLSGIGYGLYSILGTIALRKYSAYTVTTYTFLIAGVGGFFVCDPAGLAQTATAFGNPALLVGFAIACAVVTAVVPFLCYTIGLTTTEPSKAAIIATVEPLVATIVGVVVYGEALTVPGVCGIVCILAAVIILNLKAKPSPAE